MKRSFVFSLLFTAGICVLSPPAFADLAALPNGSAEAARDAGQVASLLDQDPAPAPAQISPSPVEEKKIIVSPGVLESAAIKKVQPAYPPIAKATRASGAVQVQIEVNQEGRVTEAKVLSGHPLLRQAALEAAQQWKFKPTNIDNGRTLKVQGVLTFNFRQDGTIKTDSLDSRLRNKLHPSVAGVVERLKNKQTEPLTVEATFVHNGKADLQITLADKSPATIGQLKKLGFEVTRNSKSTSVIIGRLPIEKLEALAGLIPVSYVEPVTGLSRK
ncbi:MAG TPA: energy transducer TonB [Blastocatellia bacterium]